MKRVIALLLVIGLILCAAVVLAQSSSSGTRGGIMMRPRMGTRAGMGMMRDGWGMSDMMSRMKAELGLTADQSAKLDAIHKDFMDSTQSARDDLRAKKKQMMDMWMSDTPNASAIKDLASQMETLKSQVRDSAIDHIMQARAVLTPDQRTKFRDWMKRNPRMGMGVGMDKDVDGTATSDMR